jgi:hypothetical protein
MKTRIKRSILAVLHACDGVPMPEHALLSAVRIHSSHDRPTDGDILDALYEVESSRHVSALTDDLTRDRSWTLTDKGAHKARQLRST